jgi:hypothetical protein
MDFASIFQTWMTVLTKPSEATFEAERQKPNANLTTAVIWIIIAAVLLAIFSAIGAILGNLIGGGATAMQSLIDKADLPPQVAAQLTAYTVAGVGGAATTFCFTLILAPIGFLIGSSLLMLIGEFWHAAPCPMAAQRRQRLCLQQSVFDQGVLSCPPACSCPPTN